jgi:hypothetical protein
MSRRTLRRLVTVAAAVAVATAVMIWLVQTGTFGPNGSTSRASDLPFGWWLIFGGVSVGAGMLAALIVDALFGGPSTRGRT